MPTDFHTIVGRHVFLAFNEWAAGIAPPQDPPFSRGANFPDNEWSHLFRIISVSTALSAAAVLGASAYTSTDNASFISKSIGAATPNKGSLAAICAFGLCALVYRLVAKLAKINISFRQAMFSFALVITPSVPFFLLLKTLGSSLGILWFFLITLLSLYELSILAMAIMRVTGASLFRTLASLVPMIAMALLAIIN